jgi:hypothetical protein
MVYGVTIWMHDAGWYLFHIRIININYEIFFFRKLFIISILCICGGGVN